MTVHALRHQPATVAAERVFIGAVLAGSPSAAVELGTLNEDDFRDTCARIVARVLLARQERGEPLGEPVLVVRELLSGGHAARWPDGVGPGPWVFDRLSEACPDPSAPWYAASIREDSARERLLVAATRLGQAARAESLDSIRQLVAAEFGATVAALNRVVGE